MHLKTEHQTVKQKPVELRREIDESTFIVGDFQNSSIRNGQIQQEKISKNIVELSITINQLDII